MKGIRDSVEDFVLSYMPQRLREEIIGNVSSVGEFPEEIRIRSERRASLTYGTKNIMLKTALKSEEISEMVKRLCSNSLYAYKETINAGFIPLGNGVRVGICGNAYSEPTMLRTSCVSVCVRTGE